MDPQSLPLLPENSRDSIHTTPCEATSSPSTNLDESQVAIHSQDKETPAAPPNKRGEAWSTLGWASLFVVALLLGSAVVCVRTFPSRASALHGDSPNPAWATAVKAWRKWSSSSPSSQPPPLPSSSSSEGRGSSPRAWRALYGLRRLHRKALLVPQPASRLRKGSDQVTHAIKATTLSHQQSLQQGKVLRACKQGKAFVLRSSMSCTMILSTYYKRSTPMYVKYNGGSPCQGKMPLPKGTQLCVP